VPKVFEKLMRAGEGRTLRRLKAISDAVNSIEENYTDLTDAELGPAGAYGVPLPPQRAIAVDTSFVPLGTPVYLDTQQPGGGAPLRRLVYALDTGAAIKGAARADFYWGTGDAAGASAGRMKQPGQMWLLWPIQAGAPTAR